MAEREYSSCCIGFLSTSSTLLRSAQLPCIWKANKRLTSLIKSVGRCFKVDELKAISDRGEPMLEREKKICFMPLRMGVRTVGALGSAGCDLSRESLEAIGSLIAISIERADTVEKLSRSEAARESDRLRSVLLDSVTDEFRTPLTSIKASAETLLSGPKLEEEQRNDLLQVINEESDRLNRLIGEASEVAQLDSHQLQFSFQTHHIREAVAAVKRSE